MTTERVYGLELGTVPEGHVVLEVTAVLKVLNEEGGTYLCTRNSDTLSDWEQLGMTESALVYMKNETLNNWENDDD